MRRIFLTDRNTVKMISKKNRKRKKRILFLLFLCIETIIVIWNHSMQALEDVYQPVGTMIQLDGTQIHTMVTGKEEETIVFITGSGTPCAYTDFYGLQVGLSEIATTISFDRPGFGWSEAAKTERTIINQVSELNQLLNELNQETPVTIISHSLGSLEAIAYAQTYPEKVKRMVFLDCGSPEFYSEDSEVKASIINRAMAFLRVSGWNRLISGLVKLPILGENIRFEALPEQLQALDLVMYYKMLGNPNSLSYLERMNENATMIVEKKEQLSIPFLVISTDQDQEWIQVQKQLGQWSLDYKQVILKDSSHYIHWSNEEEVIALIREFMETK